ncbi:hypothetical protein ACUVB7_002277 [Providencia rettgeri]
MKKYIFLFLIVFIMLALGYTSAHHRWFEPIFKFSLRIFSGNESISIFTSLIFMYFFLTILLYFLFKFTGLKDIADKLFDNVFPTILSSMSVFFTIAIVLGIEDVTKPDLTIISILTYFITSNAYLGTVYIVVLLFYFSLMTAVKILGLSKND